MSLTTQRLNDILELVGFEPSQEEIAAMAKAARLQVALDELPLPEGQRLHFCQTMDGLWLVGTLDGAARLTHSATRPTMLEAVLALDVALRSRA